MKLEEIILDIIGVAALLLSLYFYFFEGFDFKECTLIGSAGLALFVLQGSNVRKLVEKLITALIDKFTK